MYADYVSELRPGCVAITVKFIWKVNCVVWRNARGMTAIAGSVRVLLNGTEVETGALDVYPSKRGACVVEMNCVVHGAFELRLLVSFSLYR
jgi:hypothetical protein